MSVIIIDLIFILIQFLALLFYPHWLWIVIFSQIALLLFISYLAFSYTFRSIRSRKWSEIFAKASDYTIYKSTNESDPTYFKIKVKTEYSINNQIYYSSQGFPYVKFLAQNKAEAFKELLTKKSLFFKLYIDLKNSKNMVFIEDFL